jgi:8-oxo-dGTP pyrophosphatase MutT (NUDIX family)
MRKQLPGPYSPGILRQALHLPQFDPLPAQKLMMPIIRPPRRPPDKPGQPRQGAVLLLFYPHRDDLYLLLTRRRDDLEHHAGQVAFPGGRQEDGEPLAMTALREAQEEVGLDPTGVTLLGELTAIYIAPSDFEVHPFVGWHEGARPHFTPQAEEVAALIETPLSLFFDPAIRRVEAWSLPGIAQPVAIPYFAVQGHKVWGATAIILSEFLERLAQTDHSAA